MRVLICENKEGKRLIKAQGEEMGLEDWKETKYYDLDQTAQMISYGQYYTIHRSSNQTTITPPPTPFLSSLPMDCGIPRIFSFWS